MCNPWWGQLRTCVCLALVHPHSGSTGWQAAGLAVVVTVPAQSWFSLRPGGKIRGAAGALADIKPSDSTAEAGDPTLAAPGYSSFLGAILGWGRRGQKERPGAMGWEKVPEPGHLEGSSWQSSFLHQSWGHEVKFRS